MRKLYLLMPIFVPFLCYSQIALWEKSCKETHTDYLFDMQSATGYRFILAERLLFNKKGNKEEDNYEN